MTEQQKPSFADTAAIVVEKAKNDLSENEFRQYLAHFNAFYLAMSLGALASDQNFTQHIMNGLITPLVASQRDLFKIEPEQDKALHERAHEDLIQAFTASADIVLPDAAAYVIERAKAEGFEVPTPEEIVSIVAAHGDVDWQAVLETERFHFQKICAGIKKGEIGGQYRRPQEAKNAV